MSTGKRPTKPAQEKNVPHATHLKTENAQYHPCYKAGEVHGVPGHRTFAHQPCCRALTDGELECSWCAAGLTPEWRGYLPLWDRDWVLRYVIINSDYLETADIIPRGSQLTVSRAKNPKSPLVVREEIKLVRALPDKEPWNAPIDMELICLCLWKNEALTRWVYADRAKRSTETADIPLRVDGTPFSPMMRGAAKKYRAPEDKVISEEDYTATFKNLNARRTKGAASTNGDGKH